MEEGGAVTLSATLPGADIDTLADDIAYHSGGALDGAALEAARQELLSALEDAAEVGDLPGLIGLLPAPFPSLEVGPVRRTGITRR